MIQYILDPKPYACFAKCQRTGRYGMPGNTAGKQSLRVFFFIFQVHIFYDPLITGQFYVPA